LIDGDDLAIHAHVAFDVPSLEALREDVTMYDWWTDDGERTWPRDVLQR
jgi:hypothetical protein